MALRRGFLGVSMVVRSPVWLFAAGLGAAVACAPQKPSEDVELPSLQAHQHSGETWWLQSDFCREGSVAKPAEPADFQAQSKSGPGYEYSLEAGEFLALDVEQLGVDVTVDVWRRDREEVVLRIDSPTGTEGTEEVVLFADTPADYVLFATGAEGRFRVRVRALRMATPEDRSLAMAWRFFSQAEMGRRAGDEIAAVAELYRRAVDLWASLGLKRHEARAWEAMGRLFYRDTEHRPRSVDAFEKALSLYSSSRDTWHQARLLHRLARSWARLDSSERATALYRASLELWTGLGESREQASVLNDLANLLDQMGDLHLAIEAYSQALEIWQKLGLRNAEATTRTNLGHLYMSVGNRRQAIRHYQAALRRIDVANRHRPWILTRLGDALLHHDNTEAALQYYREALSWALKVGDRSFEALALNSIGQAEKRAQRPAVAVASYRRALALYREEGDSSAAVIVMSNLAAAYEALGQPDQAQTLFEEALELATSVRADYTLLEIHHGLARIERNRGRLELAKTHLQKALDILQEFRQRATRTDMRSSFVAIRIDVLELMVSVLVDLAQRDPEKSHVEEALHLTERFRSQGFVDELRAPCFHNQLDPAAQAQLSDLSERINDLHQKQVRSRQAPGASPIRDEEVEWLLERYWQVEANACRAVTPAERERTDVVNFLTGPGIHEGEEDFWAQRLLDPETVLLEYFLGEERSYLWAVTNATVDLHILPARRNLEILSVDLHQRLGKAPMPLRAQALRLALVEAGQQLLGPVADVLQEHSRVVVVTSGSLRSIPFASLPDPTDPSRPLLEAKEISYLPAIAALAEWRYMRRDRRRGEGLAVLADPVVAETDPRWPVGADPSSSLNPMSRLEYSADEALKIRDLAREEPAVFELGFGAHRGLLLSPEIGKTRWLHIAGHGLFDARTPALSSLVLSTIDAAGRHRDAHLRAYEIRRLRFSADLVALSACETALGEAVRGEALTGLGRSFLAAGAGSVMVSLWPVDDGATSELMSLFYQQLWVEGDSPAKALHHAQRWIRTDPRWQEPFYWAAFVLYGDWDLGT